MVGRGWDHWWVAAGLAHYLLILPAIAATELTTEPVPAPVQVSHIVTLSTYLTWSQPRTIGPVIIIKLGIWRANLEDRRLASSLVAEDPGNLAS